MKVSGKLKEDVHKKEKEKNRQKERIKKIKDDRKKKRQKQRKVIEVMLLSAGKIITHKEYLCGYGR